MATVKYFPERFEIGMRLTTYELRECYQRIFNSTKIPKDYNNLAKTLATRQPLRFVFEINRLRGYAWDSTEIEKEQL